ncbi:MAG: hypothetical protein ACLQMT_02050 [Candidatus Acidiferrales bacterium]
MEDAISLGQKLAPHGIPATGILPAREPQFGGAPNLVMGQFEFLALRVTIKKISN